MPPPACALQANFASTTCSVCGMMYCQGQESDEKLHAAYHSSHLQGIRFQARCSYMVGALTFVLQLREISSPIHLCGTCLYHTARRLASWLRCLNFCTSMACRAGRQSVWSRGMPAPAASCSCCRMTRPHTSARRAPPHARLAKPMQHKQLPGTVLHAHPPIPVLHAYNRTKIYWMDSGESWEFSHIK